MRTLFIFFLFLSFGGMAQTTRTALSGLLKDETGKAISGASVTLTHLPTKTTYGCASNLAGGYLMADVKSGGPYLLTVKFLGYKAYQVTDIFLKLDEVQVMDISLHEDIRVLEEMVVTAPKNNSQLKAAPAASLFNIGQKQIRMLPAIKRGIADFTRLNPLAFGASIAGGNYRQNFITIDGSEFNNNFGVGDNIPGNGAQPIALDAIAEISMSAAPYSSIWESGFIGSSVNIISRSGSNETEASAYTYFRNQQSYGYKIGSQQIDKHPLQYLLNGFRLGGPIIKDRLFYFVSFEREHEVYQPQVFNAATALAPYGSSVNVARPMAAELDQISEYLFNTYGYRTGPYQDYDFKNNSQKFLLRADWNIAKNNTLSVRYNQLDSDKPELLNVSRSPLVPFAASSGRRSINALPFANTNFTTGSNFYSLAIEWDYRLSANLTNMLRASYTGQCEERRSDSTPFPFVDILKDGIPFTSFGYEPFSYNNKRKVALYSLSDILHWKPGKNSWDFGFQADYINTGNSYMPFGTGYYTFSSWDDFVTGKKPLDYAITYSLDEAGKLPNYSFDYMNVSTFLQHNLALGARASLTIGLRSDFSLFPKTLPNNTELAKLTFSGGAKINTAKLPTAALLLAPRLAFSYDFFDDHSLRLRLGTGIFTGRIPFVWVISQARYSGVGQVSQTWQGQGNTPQTFNPDYSTQITNKKTDILPSVSSVLSNDFKMPQSWKSSIGLDVTLPGGLKATVETFYNQDFRSIIFRDLNLIAPTSLNVPGYADHRLIYPQKNMDKFINPLNAFGKSDPKGNNAMNMVAISNASGGYYFSALATVTKKFSNELNISLSYVKAVAKSYNDGDGDQTLSALNATPSINGINNLELANAGYVVPNRVVATLSYPLKLTQKLTLNLGMVYQGSSEGRFSYTYSRDLIGDGTNRSLIYVPSNPAEITFEPLSLTVNGSNIRYSSEEQSAAFFSYINQDRYLRNRKGTYAERNGGLLPWRHQIDLKLAAEINLGTKAKKHLVEIGIDIFNAGNLINPNWGLRKLVNTSAILIPVNLDKVSAEGNVKPVFNLATVGGKLVTETFRNDYSLNATYTMQLGLRYRFQ